MANKCEIKKPEKLNDFMYALMKMARRDSLIEFLDVWEISEKEFKEIEKWFESHGVSY